MVNIIPEIGRLPKMIGKEIEQTARKTNRKLHKNKIQRMDEGNASRKDGIIGYLKGLVFVSSI